MIRQIVTRVLTGVLVMWLAATTAFLAIHALPGRIEDVLAGDLAYPGLREAIAAQWGLDHSLLWQYGQFLLRLARGDLGTSFVMQQPVLAVLGSQLWPTIQLACAAGVLALVLALLVATSTAGLAAGRHAWASRIASALELLFTSSPVFWLGLLLLIVFSFHWRLFPVSGAAGWRALVLPAVTLALPTAGVLSQVMREALEAVFERPFVTTVRARGVSEVALRTQHVLRHALLPVVTLGGWLIGGLLGGAVITEKMFGRPGIGSVTLTAVTSQDVPVVLAVVLLAAFVHVAISTLLDVLYLFIDPRLRAS
ncbi:ABC transporter permease [Paraburkholderia silvatlantica]|uniref:Peptide/nickel transport system permease protein n=1 Tax=Paraburkholderia silvatlantica TaxID=321895 RepID=A0A2U1A840_9BURK|nr:ABC transporter permease [Paraburkholderia silvatlantica]MBB2931079.1 peptide/nickel transport system permease protein [Paraburkholderia silvatlantica]PVY28759.1 peptide/nickel transport system permease protein [Paraburkholderia silvatlantica]PXW36396.1 peptide/nickel transport system permease protein [Paraburkholderia silvatlantica]PYE21721.1 peptide/nickel transport system permease protein [Paraburkholderia silvatlantica]TDQ86843.1 peptide/nickel transport system permease protein [Parabur